ncbi:ATP-binding protein [Streptomyces sp. URMC 123]|uniref:ATP-binding protein n=1 Tax=Streptomyces sp. URMC 123 TaxID=3423403 RepID=UPI003F1A3B51
MSIWWSLHLRREAASVPLARRLLIGTMETAGVDPDISYELSVALSEACANAVEHGGGPPSGGSSEAFRVTAYLDGEKCRIEVTDSGPGFPAVQAAAGAHGGQLHGADARGPDPRSPDPRGPDPRSSDPRSSDTRGARRRTAVRRRPVATATAQPPTTAEHGRGLGLIEALADHVDFRNKPGRGAVVSFDKILKWRDDALLKAS